MLMTSFLDLQLRTKLFALYGLVLALFILAFWTAYSTTSDLVDTQERVQNKQADAVAFAKIDSNRNESRVGMLMLLSGSNDDVEARERRVQRIRELARGANEARGEVQERNQSDPWMAPRMQEYQALSEIYASSRETVLEHALAGRYEEARALSFGEQEKRFARLREMGKEMFTRAEETAQEAVANSRKAAETAKRLFFGIGIGVVIIGAISVWSLGRTVSAPLREVVAAAQRISTGDLRVEIAVGDRKDEVGLLARAFHTMVGNLRSMQREVQEGVNVLATSASEIFTATAEIAAGATETATAVSQTTATAEEVKQTAQVSAQKAGNVADIAQRAAQSAQTGRKAIDESIAGMQHIREQMELIAETVVRLSEQSQAIGEIISSVNDLAEQSNLLAVNASIEAAKAGEHGKGFGVVAHEIRNLATQSKESTAQIRTILNDIQRATTATVMAAEQGSKAVETGVNQVNQSGDAIRTLAESIVAAAQAATQITASTQEQLIGIDQVAIAIQNILQASKQNATATQQAETGAKNLNQLGQNLKAVAQKFTV